MFCAAILRSGTADVDVICHKSVLYINGLSADARLKDTEYYFGKQARLHHLRVYLMAVVGRVVELINSLINYFTTSVDPKKYILQVSL